jgi:hypothetical protein
MAVLVLGAPYAAAQALVKVNDNINFKVGILLQPQADFLQTDATGLYAENLLVRRLRFIVGGQLAKNIVFFWETENSRLGQSTTAAKNLATGFVTLDATVEWRIRKEFNLQGGLIRLPVSREALKAASSNFAIDTSAYTFQTGTPLQASSAERDTGLMARGYFLNDHLEYRVGGFQGLRDTAGRNSFRGVTRIQYDVFDTELYNMPSYPGSYLGTKKILAFGFAYDFQKTYKSGSADVYASIPTPGGAIESTLQVQYVNGGTTVTTLPQFNTEQFEAGYFVKSLKAAAYARYEQKHVAGDITKTEQRLLVGVNYYVSGNNFNIKAGWGKLHFPNATTPNTNEFILQFQAAYF